MDKEYRTVNSKKNKLFDLGLNYGVSFIGLHTNSFEYNTKL